MDHIYFIEEAIKEGFKGIKQNAGGPFGAIIVKDNVIIASAFNEVTSRKDPTAHAEILAIRKACEKLNTFQLNDCIIYSSCEPCPMCLGAIYWARLNAVYFASDRKDAAKIEFDDSFIYNQINTENHLRKIKFIKIESENSIKLFEDWFNNNNKINY